MIRFLKEIVHIIDLIFSFILGLINIVLDYILSKIPFFRIGNFIESIFLLVPNWGIKVIITIFFLILATAPFLFSREYIFKGAEDQSAWRDLRYWALAAAVTEIAVYLYF